MTNNDPDASPGVDAEPTEGTVHITTTTRCMTQCVSPGQPQRDVDIVVVGPDGELRDSGRTATDGTLDLDIHNGDSVTAIYVDGTVGANLATYMGAKPGDNLRFGDDFQEPVNGTPLGDMTIGWPALGGINQFTVYTPCGQFSAPGADISTVTSFSTNCVSGPMDIAILALDANYHPIAFARQTGVAFSAGGTINFVSWTNSTTMQVSVEGLGPEVTQLQVVLVSQFGDNFIQGDNVGGTPTDGAFSANALFAPAGSRNLAEMLEFRSDLFGPAIRIDELGDNPTEYAPAPIAVPWLGEVIANPAVGEVTWIQDGEGTYDAGVLLMEWQRAGTQSFKWAVMMPPGQENLTLPELPSSLASNGLLAGDSFDDISMYFIDYGDDADYDATRDRPEFEVDQILYSGGFIEVIPFSIAGSTGL